MDKDKHLLRRQVKLLLLGAGESGKSTFLKQMRIIHNIHFEPELVIEYQHVIYQNMLRGNLRVFNKHLTPIMLPSWYERC